MKILPLLVGLVVFLTSSLVSSETSSLPKCKGTNPDKWTNCFGTIKYENGSKYSGRFLDGRRNGQGIMTYENGSKYDGAWQSNSYHLQGGIITHIDGRKKVGEWKNGQAKIIYENGSKYIGEWVQGRRNGNGTLILPNGRKIVGYFNDGIFGNGIYKLGNLKNIWDGISFWYHKVIE